MPECDMLYKECHMGVGSNCNEFKKRKKQNKKLSNKVCRRYRSIYIFKTVADSKAIRDDGTRNT